jgi:hypothetical protein
MEQVPVRGALENRIIFLNILRKLNVIDYFSLRI